MAAPSPAPCRWTGADADWSHGAIAPTPLERRDFRADPQRADLAQRAVFRAVADPLRHRLRHADLASRRAGAMTTLRSLPAILLFGQGTAILPSRPVSAPLARAAKVKGRAAGAPWRASPLTGASTLAALPPVGGIAPLLLGERRPSERGRAPIMHTGPLGDRYPGDAADIRSAAHRTSIPGRNTAPSRCARAADGGTSGARQAAV